MSVPYVNVKSKLETLPAAVGLLGSVMFRICTPRSPDANDVTMAYVLEPSSNMSKPPGLSNSVEPSSCMLDTGAGLLGSVTLIICTASLAQALTAAYVCPSDVNIAGEAAPSSNVLGSELLRLPMEDGLVGSVMFRMRMPS